MNSLKRRGGKEAKGVEVSAGFERTVLQIFGMRDNLCRERLMDILGRVTGVQDVDVSLIRARASVVHQPPCSRDILLKTVQDAGYVVVLSGQP